MAEALWEPVWSFLLEVDLPHDVAIPPSVSVP